MVQLHYKYICNITKDIIMSHWALTERARCQGFHADEVDIEYVCGLYVFVPWLCMARKHKFQEKLVCPDCMDMVSV